MAVEARDPSSTVTVPLAGTATVTIATNATAELGRPGALTVVSVSAGNDGTLTDITDECEVTQFVELAAVDQTEDISTAVTSAPTWNEGGGPSDEDVYDITVTSSSLFAVNDYIRAQGVAKPHVYRVLEIPDMSTLRVLVRDEDGMDLEDGSVVEKVIPTGVYEATVQVPVDLVVDAENLTGSVRIEAFASASGDGSKFASNASIVWTRTFNVDMGAVNVQMR